MTRLRLAAVWFAMLTVAGCSQMTTDPAKTTAGKPGTAQSQPPAFYVPSDRGGDGGAGGY